jgi:hypothetical protein
MLPFHTPIPLEKQQKELSLTPALLVHRSKLQKNNKKYRERKKKHREKWKQSRNEYYATLEGKYYELRKLYRTRLRLTNAHKEAEKQAGERLPIPLNKRWMRCNNQFMLSLEEFLECWEGVEHAFGLKYTDRGLGLKDGKRWWSRKSYGDLKFGRADSSKPFMKGNIEIYIPVSKKNKQELLDQGWYSPSGYWKVTSVESKKKPGCLELREKKKLA